jgi:LuxR family maltose regulon positive regulatory protein
MRVASDLPAFWTGLVPRPRLTRRLLESPPAHLALLTAPAGYSKTTCLWEWEAADERPFAWVSGDRRHDDPAVLVTSIVEALDEIELVDSGVLLAMSNPHPAIESVVLPRLARSLARRSQPFVLVIDDLHLIRSRDSAEVLRVLIDSLPPGSQVALASRTEPPLPLGRLRAKRQLVELGKADLVMTRAESAEVLARIDLELSSEHVDVVFDRTEGWPAALYLAGLAISDQPDLDQAVASFAGDDRIVVDYVREEFLSGLSPSWLAFLTHSSILDQVSGPLCDTVLERRGSAKLLEELRRSNSLVIPLDRTGGSYRYHHLLAELLASELHRSEPEIETELHARASRWYAANADSVRAIDHAIAADDVSWAGELMWKAWPELSGRGRIATVGRWLDELGPDAIASSGPLTVTCAHYHLVLGEGDRAAHWAKVADRIAASAEGAPESFQADVHMLRSTLASDGVVKMGADAQRASELFTPEYPWQVVCDLYWGTSMHLTGDREGARSRLRESAGRAAAISPPIQVLALAQLSLIALEQEDWETASRLETQAREQVERCGLTDYPVVTIVFAASAMADAQSGRVERAQAERRNAERLLARLKDFPPWYEVEARIALARACIRLDDLAAAETMLEEAARYLDRTPDATVLADWHRSALASLESATEESEGRELPLTKAELRTLQHLPSHLSFREIGELVHLSPNTVKTQARAVYRKLGVTSRGEAVEKARAAGLLG